MEKPLVVSFSEMLSLRECSLQNSEIGTRAPGIRWIGSRGCDPDARIGRVAVNASFGGSGKGMGANGTADAIGPNT